MAVLPLQKSPLMKSHKVDEMDILISKTNHEKALVYFHGFPGPFEKLPPDELRIADQVHPDIVKQYDLYYPLYTLKELGEFSFEKTVDDGQRVFNFLTQQKQYSEIAMVGQSWGAVIGMSLTKTSNFSKIFLITPFLAVPSGEAAIQTVKHYSEKHPDLLLETQIPIYAEQLGAIAKTRSPREALLNCRSQTTIFASERDEVIPLATIQTIVERRPQTKLVILKGQSHKVEDRGEFHKLFANELES